MLGEGDFRGHARPTLRRRVYAAASALGARGLGALHRRIAADAVARGRLVDALSVPVTAMFRDPDVFLALRTAAGGLPERGLRVWSAGCASGEEAWSSGIVLHEAGRGRDLRLYGTDLSPAALAQAQAGHLGLDRLRDFTRDYHRSGGAGPFSRWYAARPGGAVISRALREQAVFARHDLGSDALLGRFDLVLCRNVLIYLVPERQVWVHRRLAESARPGGLLVLGRGELLPAEAEPAWEPVSAGLPLWRRRAAA